MVTYALKDFTFINVLNLQKHKIISYTKYVTTPAAHYHANIKCLFSGLSNEKNKGYHFRYPYYTIIVICQLYQSNKLSTALCLSSLLLLTYNLNVISVDECPAISATVFTSIPDLIILVKDVCLNICGVTISTCAS